MEEAITPYMNLRSRLLAVISALIGLALFIYVIKQTGLSEIASNLRSVGAGFLLILAVSSTRYLSRAMAWLRCMNPEERRVGFWALWRARLAGEAVGDLTFGPVVAEPMRLIALGDRLSLSSGISSLAVENVAYAVSSCLMVMAGAVALLAGFGLNESMRTAALIALAVVVALVAAPVATISRRWKIGSSLLSALADLVAHDETRRGRIEAKIDRLRELEDYVFDFYAKRPRDFFILVLCQAAFHLAGAVEIYLTLRLMGLDVGFVAAGAFESVNRAINMAFTFVPALVGVDEAGTGALVKAAGFDFDHGVTLALIRKIRMFFWIGIGLVFLAASRNRK
ncbi:MAG TPA: lysylphosphatidylglycerol synthase domain-containing protein [Blastocatellia bacterium]|nr:lysylphosphatidylglycerol synthase domain-containing protein [Blastocatellia bacterium]